MSPDAAFILSLVVRVWLLRRPSSLACPLSRNARARSLAHWWRRCRFQRDRPTFFLRSITTRRLFSKVRWRAFPSMPRRFFYCATYARMAQRQGSSRSVARWPLSVWLVLALLARTVHWSLGGGILMNVIAFAICLPILQRYRGVTMSGFTRRWYDIPLRATLVATLVAAVVTLSRWVGPDVSGTIALFPVVFTSMMLILQPRIGGPSAAAVFANSGWGLLGLGLAARSDASDRAAARFGCRVKSGADDLRRSGISASGVLAAAAFCAEVKDKASW